jgi:hypothetical protein
VAAGGCAGGCPGCAGGCAGRAGAGAGAGCAGAGAGCAKTGTALIAINDSASDAAIAEPLIALIPFVSRKPLILYQMP